MRKRAKYRKQQRGRMRGKAYRGSMVVFGEWGLMALEPAWVTNRQRRWYQLNMTFSFSRTGVRTGPSVPLDQRTLRGTESATVTPEKRSAIQ